MWEGVDSAWEQEKLEARKILENAADSHTADARFVRRHVRTLDHLVSGRCGQRKYTFKPMKMAMESHGLTNARMIARA